MSKNTCKKNYYMLYIMYVIFGGTQMKNSTNITAILNNLKDNNNKYSSILYLCNFTHTTGKIM